MPAADDLYLLSQKANDARTEQINNWQKHFQWLEEVVLLAKQSRGITVIPKTPGRKKRNKKTENEENQPPDSPVGVRKSSRAAAKAAKEKNKKTLTEISNLNAKIRRPSSPSRENSKNQEWDEIKRLSDDDIVEENIYEVITKENSNPKQQTKDEIDEVDLKKNIMQDAEVMPMSPTIKKPAERTRPSNSVSMSPPSHEAVEMAPPPAEVVQMAPPPAEDIQMPPPPAEDIQMPPPPSLAVLTKSNLQKFNEHVKNYDSANAHQEQCQPSVKPVRPKRAADAQVTEEVPMRTTRTKKRKMLEEESKIENEAQNRQFSDSSKEESEVVHLSSPKQSNADIKILKSSVNIQKDEEDKGVANSNSPEIPKRITRSKIKKVNNEEPKTPVKHHLKTLNLNVTPKNKLNSPNFSHKLHGSTASESLPKHNMNQEKIETEVQEVSIDSIQVSSSPGKVYKHKWNNNMGSNTTNQTRTRNLHQTPSPLSSSSSKKILGLKSLYSSGNLQSSYSQKRAPIFSSSPKVGSKGLGLMDMTQPKNVVSGPSFLTKVQPSKPTKEEAEEKKLEELRKKREREEEILRKKNELLRQKKEEHKKKNEERMRRVQEAREARERKAVEARELQEREKRLREDRVNDVKQKKINEAKKLEEAKLLKKKQAEEEQRKEEKRLREEQMLEEQRKKEEKRIREEQILEMQAREEKRKIEERRAKLEEQRREAERIARERLEMEKLKEAERIAREERQREAERIAKEAKELERRKEAERIAREQKELERLRMKEQENRSSEKNLNSTYNTNSDERNLNATYTKPAATNKGDDIQSYEMTPVAPKKKSNDPNDYGINDLKSDDSTDDESDPKKKIPLWAQGSQLKKHLFYQEHYPPDIDAIFPPRILLQMPDLNIIFSKRRSRFTKRTSSAVWNTPPSKLLNLSAAK